MTSKSAKKNNGKKKRTIEQRCSVCRKDFEMEVVEGDENSEVLWLRCPQCEGYLPYMTSEGIDEDSDGGVSVTGGEDDLALEDIDRDKAVEYEETAEYEIDDIIYHRSWNDYGKVIAKETLPGNRKTIVVKFVGQGNIRLLEGVT